MQSLASGTIIFRLTKQIFKLIMMGRKFSSTTLSLNSPHKIVLEIGWLILSCWQTIKTN